MKGFTLVEIVVVIGLLSIVSLIGMNSITEFQKNAILVAATQELASTIRTAQTDSTAGQLKPGETSDTFEKTGLPYFGISLNGNTYQFIRKYTLSGSGTESTDTLETHTIDPSIVPSPTPITLTFSRITGTPSSTVIFTLTRVNSTISRTVTVNSYGLISL